MTALERSRDVPRSQIDNAATTAPLIVNGLTVRPRKKGNLWLLAVCLLPDFVALLVIAGLGMHRLLRYLYPKGKT